MPDNGAKAQLLEISRLLTVNNQAHLLSLVQVAYAAEKSVRKSLGFDPAPAAFPLNSQEFSCCNNFRRSKK